MGGWVAYVDESGSSPGARDRPGRFVLACVAGSTEAIDVLAEKIRRLKLGLVPGADPADWELHAGDMFHDRGGSPLGFLGMEKKMSIMRDVVNIVCDSDVVLFEIVVTGASMHGKQVTDTKITEHAAALLVERLERLVQDLGGGTTLHVISDNMRERHRLAMKKSLERWRAGRRSPGPRAVTGMSFIDSLDSALIQVADAIAYVINRHAGGDVMFGGLFRDIERKARSLHRWNEIRMGSGRRAGSTRSRRP